MLLLSGHSLAQVRKVPLEALSLNLTERDSTASMIPADMTGISIDSWFQDDTAPGAGVVWRVKSISQAFATDTPTVELEHVINTLKDNVIFGEITAAQITGNDKATECSAEQAIRFILSYQSDWVLGSFDYAGVSNPYKFDGESLYDAIETVSNSLSSAWWSYDTTVYPFRLNINVKSARTDTEMRAGRNLTTITKTIDKSQMITRIYPIGKDDIHIPGDYVEQNANIYGVVSRVDTDTSIDDVNELARWARERLAAHCTPTVTIEVEGVELADATGESLDRMRLGSYCRIPLEEFGTEITERIITVNYPDKVHQPTLIKLTLANNITDIVKIVADAIKKGSGGGGGRAAAKQQKEDHAWFEDTDEHVAMVAESIIGRDAEGNPDWYRLSQIIVDGEGIHQSVEEIKAGDVIRDTRIEQNENAIVLEANQRMSDVSGLSSRITIEADRITSEVNNRISSETELSSRITQTATQITAEVSARTSADNALSSRITINANGIATKVSKDGVISAINQSAEAVTISASKINLDGYVTTSQLEAAFSDISQITVNQLTVSQNGYFTFKGYNVSWKELAVGTKITVTSSGGTVTGVDLIKTTIHYLGR